MRLIDADALEQVLDDRAERLKDERALYGAAAVVTALDRFAPTIDAVPIDRMLEIIDVSERLSKQIPQKHGEEEALSRGVAVACENIRREVLALKGNDAK